MSDGNRPTDDQLKAELTDMQYKVARCLATEPPFANEYWNNKSPGIYVDVVSGEPADHEVKNTRFFRKYSVKCNRSNIEHRAARIAGEGGHCDFSERLLQRGGDLVPCEADGLAGFAFAGDGALEQRGIHGIDDLAQGDRLRGACQQVSACLAAAALDEAGAAQIIEDLHKKIS